LPDHRPITRSRAPGQAGVWRSTNRAFAAGSRHDGGVSAAEDPLAGAVEGPRGAIGTGRVEAFSDGVMAVIITIMVLELRRPSGARFSDLGTIVPGLIVYVLSFVMIGIYWNNHHHLFLRTERISGAVMWANLHLLFWLSLVPIVTEWTGAYYRDHLPAAAYGVVCLGAAVSFTLLTRAIVTSNGRDSDVARAIGDDRQGRASLAVYVAGIALSAASPYAGYACYATVSAIWFVPDRRMVR
jgi:uncharacterized membrane protein